MLRHLTELTSKSVPAETSFILYKDYITDREEDWNYVVLPNQSFNAYFGTTAFSQNWAAAITEMVIKKKCSEGVSKYELL